MSDEEIRALLAGLPPASMLPCPSGHVAFLRGRVEQAGGDHESVAAWVEHRGGFLDRTAPIVSQSLGRTYGEETPGEDFYVMPRAALGE